MAAVSLPARTRRLPTVLVLDFSDSYTANILRLIHQIAHPDAQAPGDAAAGAQWDCTGWTDRVVVVNVDSLSW